MASNCNNQEAVIDSGVDSEATTPSSPEDDPHEHDNENSNSRQTKSAVSTCKRTKSIDEASDHQLSDEMVLETAETLLALSGKSKSSSNGDTAIVLPRQPPQSSVKKGRFCPFIQLQPYILGMIILFSNTYTALFDITLVSETPLRGKLCDDGCMVFFLFLS